MKRLIICVSVGGACCMFTCIMYDLSVYMYKCMCVYIYNNCWTFVTYSVILSFLVIGRLDNLENRLGDLSLELSWAIVRKMEKRAENAAKNLQIEEEKLRKGNEKVFVTRHT